MADPNLFVLKGGVNLRFFFNSPRYSEDMDLDVLAGSVATLKKNGYKILADGTFRRTLRTNGIADLEVGDPQKAKHTQTTQRFKVQLITEAGDRLPSTVEFSRRTPDNLGIERARIDPQIALQYKRLTYHCRHYTGKAASLQKVLALAGRAVTQARDVFDLDILQRGGHAKENDLASSLTPAQRSAALERLDSLTYSDYQGQVLEYLADDDRTEYGTPEAWKTMLRSVRALLKQP